eukprot:scaffold6655_cov169-Amphora_coffeaeformis.AAC.1
MKSAKKLFVQQGQALSLAARALSTIFNEACERESDFQSQSMRSLLEVRTGNGELFPGCRVREIIKAAWAWQQNVNPATVLNEV